MTREFNEQSYYLRARIRLILRLDEFNDASGTPVPPVQPPHWRKGAGVDPSTKLTVQQDPTTGAWSIGPSPSSGSKTGADGPQAQSSSSDLRTFEIDNIFPKKMTICRNGIRVADTLEVAFRWLDLPIDPRTVRSCGVVAYLGTIKADDYASAMAFNQVAPLPDSYVDAFGRQRSNQRFTGFVDEWATEFPEEDDPITTIQCTDNTSLLIDIEAPAKLTIGPKDPIDKALATYLSNFPQLSGMSVEFRPAGSTPPALAASIQKTAGKPDLGPSPAGGAGGGSGSGGSKTSVWDYVTDVLGSLGLIGFIEDEVVVIQRPRTLYGSKFVGRPGDPFTGRILPGGRVLTRRTFVYGRNIQSQSFKRKLRRPGQHNNIEVRCYSQTKGVTQIARFPGTDKELRQKKLTPGNDADEAWHVHTVAGVEDPAMLAAIAQSIYEQGSRHELEVRFQTLNAASYGGDNDDPDLLDMQAGDPIDVEVATSNGKDASGATSSIATAQDALASRASDFLVKLGFDSAFASAYGKSVGNEGLSSTFRVKTVTLDWSDDYEEGGSDSDGLTIDIEAMNYIEVRQEKELPDGQETQPAGPTASPVQVVIKGDTSGGPGPWI